MIIWMKENKILPFKRFWIKKNQRIILMTTKATISYINLSSRK